MVVGALGCDVFGVAVVRAVALRVDVLDWTAPVDDGADVADDVDPAWSSAPVHPASTSAAVAATMAHLVFTSRTPVLDGPTGLDMRDFSPWIA